MMHDAGESAIAGAGAPPPAAGGGDFLMRPAKRAGVPIWLWVVSILAFVGVVAMQRPGGSDRAEVEKLKNGEVVRSEAFSIETMLGKMMLFLRGGGYAPETNAGAGQKPDDPVLTILEQLKDQAAASEFAQDLFRAAVLAGEFEGPGEMKARFAALSGRLSPGSDLHADMETATGLYEAAMSRHRAAEGTSAVGDAAVLAESGAVMPTEARVQSLIQRRGGVGKGGATAPEAWGHRGGPGAPAATIASGGSNAGSLVDFRKESVGDGLALFAILGTFGVVVVVGLLSGIVLLIVGAVLVGTGTLKRWSTPWRDEFAELKPGLRGGRVWLETFTLFSLGFLALVGLRYVIPFRRMGVDPLWFGLLSQWVLVLVLLWPVARGVPWRMTRALVGWHRGRGVAREVMFGVGAYLASLPVYVVAVLIVVVLMMLYEMITGRKAVPPSADRLVDMASGGLLQTIMVFLLVVVWAPVVEESIFRGNLYRLVRGKAGALAAVVISAGAFALMHPYLMVQLVAIFSLGAVFALMRESRGSLIPSMTAHALHNGTVFTLLTLLIHFGSDR